MSVQGQILKQNPPLIQLPVFQRQGKREYLIPTCSQADIQNMHIE
jgi:hypothetical protein